MYYILHTSLIIYYRAVLKELKKILKLSMIIRFKKN